MKIFGIFLALLVIAMIGSAVYLAIADVSVPQTTVTKDVSGDLLPPAPAPQAPEKSK